MFPPSIGFPDDGFRIFRRERKNYEGEKGEKLPDQLSPGSRLEIGESAVLETLDTGQFKIAFSTHVVQVRVRFNRPGHINFQAFAGNYVVDTAPEDDPATRQVEASIITHVIFNNDFISLNHLNYLTEHDACRDPLWGSPIVHLPLPASVNDLPHRLEANLRNRFADSPSQAVTDYASGAREAVEWLGKLAAPTIDDFEDIGVPPDRLRIVTLPEKGPLVGIYPLPTMLLAANNPILARFLSLYYVDRYVAEGPRENRAYDYKVEGTWRMQEGTDRVLCGLLFNIGAQESGLPAAPTELKAFQLPGIRWNGKRPEGRVGLNWNQPERFADAGSGAIEPVAFDVSRRATAISGSNFRLLTKESPVVVPRGSWQNNLHKFLDTGVPINPSETNECTEYEYKVQSIDLFGQTSAPAGPARVCVEDLTAPPNPVRLRALLHQDGYPWLEASGDGSGMLKVTFEYGAMQHQQAPDVKTFSIYWRLRSLFERVRVRVANLTEESHQGDIRVYKGQVSVVSQDPPTMPPSLSFFTGGTLSRTTAEDHTLPAEKRIHFRVDQLGDDGQITLGPSTDIPQPGEYDLVSDPRNLQSGWTPAGTADFRSPVTGTCVSVEEVWRTRAAGVVMQKEEPDPLHILPAGHAPVDPHPPTFKKILLDRALLEPDLFTGGVAKTDSQTFPILFSRAGLSLSESSESSAAFIAVPADANIPQGTSLDLRPAEQFDVSIETIEDLTKGRIRAQADSPFEPPAGFLNGGHLKLETNTYRILSASHADGKLELEGRLLRGDAKVADLPNAGTILPPQVGSVTIQNASAPRFDVHGGELAFEEQVEEEERLRILRVMSDVHQEGDHLEMLVRLPRATWSMYDGLTAGTECRYYAPYFNTFKVGLAPGPEIVVPITEDRAMESIYIGVCTKDSQSIQGPLSPPVQVVVVKPPPAGAPGAPYPCTGAGKPDTNRSEGFAMPPDLRGYSTLCIAWNTGTLSPAEGLRFEVQRTMDESIISTHRRKWLSGMDMSSPLVAQPQADISLGSVNGPDDRGRFDAEAVSGLDDADVADLRGTRVSQAGCFFEITIAKRIGGKTQVLLRPTKSGPEAGIPQNGAATVQAAPDYTVVREDPIKAKELASIVTDAFSMVTGTPVAARKYLDQIPGRGRNRFFYRVRAVDAAENRSQWSPVSVPFNQVDISAPGIPQQIEAELREGANTISWNRSFDDQVTGYRIHRFTGVPPHLYAEPSSLIAKLSIGPGPNHVQPQLHRVKANALDLETGLSVPLAISDGTSQGVLAVYKFNSDSEPDTAIDYLVRAATELSGSVVTKVNPSLADNTAVVLVVLKIMPRILNLHATGDRLNVRAGKIILDYPYAVTQIAGVFSWDDFDYSLSPFEAQPGTNHFAGGATFDASAKEVSGINLPDGSEVVVIARCFVPVTLGATQDESPLLFAKSGEINLHNPLHITDVLGVYKFSDFDWSASPLESQTGTNHFSSSANHNEVGERIDGLGDAISHIEPIVVLVKRRRADGTEFTAAFSQEPLTGECLVVRAGTIMLKPNFDPAGIAAVFKYAEFVQGRPFDQQNAFNFHLSRKTTVHMSSRRLVDLNPTLADGTAVAILYKDREDAIRISEARNDRWEFIDEAVDAGLSDEDLRNIRYCVVAVKNVPKGPDSENLISVYSRPSKLVLPKPQA